jgi:hypothetical protein
MDVKVTGLAQEHMTSPIIHEHLATIIIAELQNIRSEIQQIKSGASVGGTKQWLKPSEFAKLCGLSTRTLSLYASTGRFSDRAVRRVKRGSGFLNQFHRKIAMEEIQNPKSLQLL